MKTIHITTEQNINTELSEIKFILDKVANKRIVQIVCGNVTSKIDLDELVQIVKIMDERDI